MKKLILRRETAPVPEKQYTIKYKEELNAAQYDAVMYNKGALLIIAGAGTGKTRTLVYRLARLIEDGIPPKSILLLTFTRKAAQEMLRRAALLLDSRCDAVSGGTFHSFANQVLRRYATLLGFEPNFSVLDQSDSEDVVNLLRSGLLGNSKRRFPKKNTLAAIYSAIVNRKQTLTDILQQKYPQYVEDEHEIGALFSAYQEYKRKHNCMDYDDLLVYVHVLLRDFPAVRAQFNADYTHILVDEYQDTNSLQHSIVVLLAGANQQVTAVGDDAQSIYAFRGADYKNIMTFPESFSSCNVITLEENFRSTQAILNLANEVIRNAAWRYDKELFSHRTGGENPWIIRAATADQQAQFVCQHIIDTREQGVPLEEIAVLFRSGFHSFELEVELQKNNIPFRKFGGLKFIETAHVKDMIAFLRLLVNPKDAVSWNRVLLLHKGIGPKTAAACIELIMSAGGTGFSLANDKISLLGKHTEAFSYLLQTLRKYHGGRATVGEIMSGIYEYYLPLLQVQYDDYKKRIRDIETLLDMAGTYESLPTFLIDMALDPPTESVEEVDAPGKDDEMLTLSTIHSAKGLEWKVVFIIWALDGRFPPARAYDTVESLEEERRLMYVACTRAKDLLYISYPINIFDRETGSVLSKPSPFLDTTESFAERYMLTQG